MFKRSGIKEIKQSFTIFNSLFNFTNVRTKTSKKVPKCVLSEIFVEEGKSILNMTIRFQPIHSDQTNLHLDCGENVKNLPDKLQDDSSNTASSDNEKFFYDMLKEACQQFTNRGIVTLLEASPREIMTSKFCITALKNILRIYENRTRSGDSLALPADTADQNVSENLYVHQLIDRLIEIGEPEDLLTTLEMLIEKRTFLKDERALLCEKLVDQVTKKIITGQCSLNQVLDAIVLFTKYKEKPEFSNIDIRSLWIGIHLNTSQISSEKILALFQHVDSIPDVSDYIIALIDRTILRVRVKYTYSDIRRIITAMNNIQLYSNNMNYVISKWFVSNVSTFKVNQYQEFLLDYSRNRLQEHNPFIERGLEIFMEKYKNRINYPTIFVRTSNYMKQHRIANPKICNIFIEILTKNANKFHPNTIMDIFSTLGYLQYKPSMAQYIEFWTTMENYIYKNFYKLRPSLLIVMLQNLIYLNYHTSKFVPKFKEARFQSIVEQLDPNDLIKLQIYDVSMTFETLQYPGPIFRIQDKVRNVPIMPEPYTIQVISRIEISLRKVLEKRGFSHQIFFHLDFMPLSNEYIIDVFAYPKDIQRMKITEFLRKNPYKSFAVLVKAPYHVQYGSKKELVGPQQVRRRHFDHLNIRTVDLDGEECMAMSYQPHLIEDYLDRLILQANTQINSVNS